MAETGEHRVAEIREDLSCPACEYNLRGLRGTIVQCPECGATCDVAKLIANRWRRPWYKAPKLNRVYVATAWFFLGTFGTLVAVGVVRTIDFDSDAYRVPMIAIPAVSLIGWAFALRRSYGIFESGKGIWLALLGHLLLISYVVAVMAGLLSIMMTVGALLSTDVLQLIIAGLILAAAAVVLYLSWRGEKFVAEHCIRRYLELQAAAES